MFQNQRERDEKMFYKYFKKGKCRIRGPSKNQTRTNSWILVSVNQFWWGIEPPYSSLLYFLHAGETNFGTPEEHVEPRGL